jgi:Zn-dependent protease
MDIRDILVQAFVILFAISVHEAAHGWAALKRGDPTAFRLGRVTLNPLAHIDPVGTVLVPLIFIINHLPPFGWAKPVPFDPRLSRRDSLWIGLAGPASNIAAGTLMIAPFLLIKSMGASIPVNSVLAKPFEALYYLLIYFIMINLALAVFNLIPLPPFDGHWILAGLLPKRLAAKYEALRPYGMFILAAIVLLRIPKYIISPVLKFVEHLVK